MRRCVITGLGLAAGLICAGCRATPPTAAWSGVVAAGNGPGGSLLRYYDTTTLQPAADLKLPGRLVAVAPNPGQPQLDVLTVAPNALIEIDDATRGIGATVPLPAVPSALVFSRDGRRVVVSVGMDLLAVDLASRAILTRATIGASLSNLAFTPDDTRLVGTDPAGRALVWLDPNRLTRVGATPLQAAPDQLAMLSYGRKLFALCPAGNQIAVADTVSGQLLTYLPVGPQPVAMLLKPDGGELYVANRGGGTISVINTGTNEVSGTMWAGKGPDALAISGDGAILYVANADANTVAGLSTDDRREIANINVGQQPVALALGPQAKYVFAADVGSSDLAVLHADLGNADHRNLVNLLPAPPSARRLILLP